jgi:glycosyltransferase involved in cell wall biosynthesis
MKIGIDARMYGPEQGGLGRYVEQLILNLEQLKTTQDEFVIFLRKNNWQSYQPAQPHFKKVLADIPWYGWKEQLFLPSYINQEQVDLMHFPHWNVPLFYQKPFIVTIHDLLLLHHPTREASRLGPVTYWFKNQMYKKVLKHAAVASTQIIATSEFTKQDIVSTLHITPQKISVTYQAPLTLATLTSPAERNNILKKHGITKPYVLYVGVAYPHKNLPRLLEAWQLLGPEISKQHQLVLVGKKNFFYEKLFTSKTAQQAPNLVYTDFVSDNELATLYQEAKLYIFPSLYEGFGLPPLEAMKYGIPVASSNQTCLPEILQNAALYFNPLEPLDIAKTITTGLTDTALRTQLSLAGQKLCSQYSWKTLASKTLDLYHLS